MPKPSFPDSFPVAFGASVSRRRLVFRFVRVYIIKMSQQWIIRVEGKEYGPAEVEDLHEWKADGRVLPENAARLSDSDTWIRASDIPGLFEPAELAPPVVVEIPAAPERSVAGICSEALGIFCKGFWQFFGLTLLVVLPTICAQMTGAYLEGSSAGDADMRKFLSAGFALCMLCLFLAAWPIYLAGVQILTNEIVAGRRIGIFPLLNEAVKFWGRVAMLCIFVYGSFFFWTLVPLLVILMIVLGGGPSLLSTLGVLALCVIQVWMMGRLFVNFMFWQQFAVLDGADVSESLRQSREVARSGRELIWYQRPLWRGVFIFSLWTAFVVAVNLPALWPDLVVYWQQVSKSQDPEALMQAMRAAGPRAHEFKITDFALGMLQAILRPWVGIAFVLLYFGARGKRPNHIE